MDKKVKRKFLFILISFVFSYSFFGSKLWFDNRYHEHLLQDGKITTINTNIYTNFGGETTQDFYFIAANGDSIIGSRRLYGGSLGVKLERMEFYLPSDEKVIYYSKNPKQYMLQREFNEWNFSLYNQLFWRFVLEAPMFALFLFFACSFINKKLFS